ncbi:MAG TPA: 2-octaprenyl-3-methyl-6-methoxy-1,4-benzoquinol hydroxylase, partial [Caldimonas sp.]
SDYGQRAVAARLVATLPHRHTARQWFRSPDVLALLPFDRPEPGRSYALVWSLPSERADTLLAMDATAFERTLAAAAGADVGLLALA